MSKFRTGHNQVCPTCGSAHFLWSNQMYRWEMAEAAPDLLKALEDLIDMNERDERGDPDYLATDSWRAEVWLNARNKVAQAKGE